MKRNLYGGRKFDGHSVPLIAFNYIVILDKLGLADERTTICSFQKLGSESQGQFVFKRPAVTHMTLK